MHSLSSGARCLCRSALRVRIVRERHCLPLTTRVTVLYPVRCQGAAPCAPARSNGRHPRGGELPADVCVSKHTGLAFVSSVCRLTTTINCQVDLLLDTMPPSMLDFDPISRAAQSNGAEAGKVALQNAFVRYHRFMYGQVASDVSQAGLELDAVISNALATACLTHEIIALFNLFVVLSARPQGYCRSLVGAKAGALSRSMRPRRAERQRSRFNHAASVASLTKLLFTCSVDFFATVLFGLPQVSRLHATSLRHPVLPSIPISKCAPQLAPERACVHDFTRMRSASSHVPTHAQAAATRRSDARKPPRNNSQKQREQAPRLLRAKSVCLGWDSTYYVERLAPQCDVAQVQPEVVVAATAAIVAVFAASLVAAIEVVAYGGNGGAGGSGGCGKKFVRREERTVSPINLEGTISERESTKSIGLWKKGRKREERRYSKWWILAEKSDTLET
eukprot:131511-Pleurochrysis_carterae.AAC.4